MRPPRRAVAVEDRELRDSPAAPSTSSPSSLPSSSRLRLSTNVTMLVFPSPRRSIFARRTSSWAYFSRDSRKSRSGRTSWRSRCGSMRARSARLGSCADEDEGVGATMAKREGERRGGWGGAEALLGALEGQVESLGAVSRGEQRRGGGERKGTARRELDGGGRGWRGRRGSGWGWLGTGQAHGGPGQAHGQRRRLTPRRSLRPRFSSSRAHPTRSLCSRRACRAGFAPV